MKQEIKCPKCHWTPSKEDLWECECGTGWNTFETAGECPGCKKVWTDTQCCHCNEWSAHTDWYPDTIIKLLSDNAEFTMYIKEEKQFFLN